MNNRLSPLEKNKIFILLGVVIIIILVVLIVINQRNLNSKPKVEDVIIPVVSETKTPVETGTSSQFRTEVPLDVKVPEPNEKLTETQKTEIAVPTISVPAAPGVVAKYRGFEIKAADNKFTPTKIIVNLGDTVNIRFTAVDKDYDIIFRSYNMKQVALKGETKIIEFQAVQAGNYLYYCERCGGVTSSAQGNIIVVK